MRTIRKRSSEKILCICEICAKEFIRTPSQVRTHTFCSRECSRQFTSKRMTEYNETENSMNKPQNGNMIGNRTREEVRKARRETALLLNGGYKKTTYKKFDNRPEHRVVAEQMLGRKLKPGEVVHHIDGNRQNNAPSNLMVFKNANEHTKYHHLHPEESGALLRKKVMPNVNLKQPN